MVARIHPEALAEMAEAAKFYENRAPGVKSTRLGGPRCVPRV